MYAEDNLLLGSITVPVPVGPEGKEKVRVRYQWNSGGRCARRIDRTGKTAGDPE